jgi:response regulator RpfG family c-di-GMP phosphodiesterase
MEIFKTMSPLPILFVDDDANVLSAYQRTLRKRFKLDTAQSGDAGLGKLDQMQEPYAVIVADMQMPGMNGIDFLKRVKEKSPDSVRLMLTGNADQKTAIEAINLGQVFSFLCKPCPPESLEIALDNALRQYQLIRAEKELLEETLNGSIKVFTDILAIVDPEAFGHAQRLREEVTAVAKWFGIARSWEFEIGAMLSPIGAVAIPPVILNRFRTRQPLNDTEKQMIARIPEIGANLISKIPRMEQVEKIVRYQNKNFDGTGYPEDGVTGADLPMGARILHVLSDLIVTEGNRKSRAEAFGQLKQRLGVYDPAVLEAVASCFDIYLAEPSEPRQIPFSELRVGHIITSDILTTEGTLVVASGAQISQALMKKLHNFSEISGLREPLSVL